MNITKSIYISSVGSHFKDNEGIYAYQYSIAITWPKYMYKYIGEFGVKSVNLFYEICLIIE